MPISSFSSLRSCDGDQHLRLNLFHCFKTLPNSEKGSNSDRFRGGGGDFLLSKCKERQMLRE